MIPDMLIKEIAEKAISYMDDEGILNDFLEDRDIELTSELRIYFGIADDEEDDDYDY